jgi:membrane protein DedA with SNARE-associated domain
MPVVVDTLPHLLEHVLAHLGRNAPAVALVAAFLESVIGLGALFPGGTAVVLAGFTVRDQGIEGLLVVAALAWLGMTLGAVFDFWLGRLAGRRLVPAWVPWRLASRWHWVLRSSRGFMRRWGWWAVLLANLAGPGRATIAVASGASGWSFGAFLAVQCVAAALWSATFAGIGYFAAGEADRLEVVVSAAGLAMALVFALLLAVQLAVTALVKLAARRLRARTAPASAS